MLMLSGYVHGEQSLLKCSSYGMKILCWPEHPDSSILNTYQQKLKFGGALWMAGVNGVLIQLYGLEASLFKRTTDSCDFFFPPLVLQQRIAQYYS